MAFNSQFFRLWIILRAMRAASESEAPVVAPTDITIAWEPGFALGSVPENTYVATDVLIAVVTSNGDSPLTLSMSADTEAKFTLTDNADGTANVYLNAALNYEADTGHAFEITASNSGGTYSEVFAITVSNVVEAPTDISIVWQSGFASGNVPEDTYVSTPVHIATVTAVGESTPALTLTADTESKFSITDNGNGTANIYVDSLLDYEADTSHSFEVTATNAGGAYAETFNVNVTNVTEPTRALFSTSYTAQNGTAQTSTPVTGVTATTGALVVVSIACDNAATGGTSPISSVTDAAGNTYVQQFNTAKSAANAVDDGTVGAIFAAQIPSNKQLSAATVTVNYSTNVTRKAISVAVFSPENGAGVCEVKSVGTTYVNPGSATAMEHPTPAKVYQDQIILAISAAEATAVGTVDADTLSGSWSSNIGVASSSGANGTSQALGVQYKQATAENFQSTSWSGFGTFDNLINWIVIGLDNVDPTERWKTAVVNRAWTTSNLNSAPAGASAHNIRMVVSGADLTANLASNGSKVKLRLRGPTTDTTIIDDCFIGEKASGTAINFASAPTRVTFGSANGKTLAAFENAVSDDITLTIDRTKDYVIALHTTATAQRHGLTNVAGRMLGAYKAGASEASTESVTGYTGVSGTTVSGSQYIVCGVEAYI